MLEQAEQVLEVFNEDGQSLFDCFGSQEELEQNMRGLVYPEARGNKPMYDLDVWTKLAINDLVKQRMNGKFSNDDEAFKQELRRIKENIGFDQTRQVMPASLFSTALREKSGFGASREQIQQDVLQELYNDRHRMQHELQMQIEQRVKKHTSMTKRVDTDFIAPRVNEA